MSLRTRLAGGIPAVVLLLIGVSACTPSEEAAGTPESEEDETLSRTEFTDRVENFFEYTPLHAGIPSAFLIHLTDLSDGTPVAQAQVELTVRSAGTGNAVASTTAQVGRVTGIYVADVSIPSPGTYDIEFTIRNDRLDVRMPLTGFDVEGE
jgi:5-hydroxyisourate hydrolase-like protein (transthyretin family)